MGLSAKMTYWLTRRHPDVFLTGKRFHHYGPPILTNVARLFHRLFPGHEIDLSNNASCAVFIHVSARAAVRGRFAPEIL